MRRVALFGIALVVGGCAAFAHAHLVRGKQRLMARPTLHAIPHGTVQSPAEPSRSARQSVHAIPDGTGLSVTVASRVGADFIAAAVTDDAGRYWLCRSGDGGRTWSEVGPLPGAPTAVAFADDKRGWLLSTADEPSPGTLLTTRDGGAHWVRRLVAGAQDVAASAGFGYLLAHDELYVAPPGSTRFVPLTHVDATRLTTSASDVVADGLTQQQDGAPEAAVVTGRQVTRVVIPCGSGGGRVLTDFTADLAVLGGGRLLAECGSEPAAGEQVKRGLLSVDGGRTWRQTSAPDDASYLGVMAVANGRVFLAEGRYPALLSMRTGGRWHARITTTSDGWATAAFADDQHGLALTWGYPSVLYLTDDGGRTWRVTARPS